MKLDTILEEIINDDVSTFLKIFYFNFTNSVTFGDVLMTLFVCYLFKELNGQDEDDEDKS